MNNFLGIGTTSFIKYRLDLVYLISIFIVCPSSCPHLRTGSWWRECERGARGHIHSYSDKIRLPLLLLRKFTLRKRWL